MLLLLLLLATISFSSASERFIISKNIMFFICIQVCSIVLVSSVLNNVMFHIQFQFNLLSKIFNAHIQICLIYKFFNIFFLFLYNISKHFCFTSFRMFLITYSTFNILCIKVKFRLNSCTV